MPLFTELGSFFRASLLDPAHERAAEDPRVLRRRRIVVALTLVLGGAALGLALAIRPGDPWFYPATLGVFGPLVCKSFKPTNQSGVVRAYSCGFFGLVEIDNGFLFFPRKSHALDLLFAFKQIGNVYTKGTQPLACDAGALAQPEFAPNVQLAERTDGWYVTLSAGARWRGEAKGRLATTASLGRAHVTGCAYESPDGTPLAIDADYFGSRRDGLGPMPGPFETVGDGTSTFKVW